MPSCVHRVRTGLLLNPGSKHSTPTQPIGGGEEEPLLDGLNPYDWASWEVGRDGIYHVRRDPAVLELIAPVAPPPGSPIGSAPTPGL